MLLLESRSRTLARILLHSHGHHQRMMEVPRSQVTLSKCAKIRARNGRVLAMSVAPKVHSLSRTWRRNMDTSSQWLLRTRLELVKLWQQTVQSHLRDQLVSVDQEQTAIHVQKWTNIIHNPTSSSLPFFVMSTLHEFISLYFYKLLKHYTKFVLSKIWNGLTLIT